VSPDRAPTASPYWSAQQPDQAADGGPRQRADAEVVDRFETDIAVRVLDDQRSGVDRNAAFQLQLAQRRLTFLGFLFAVEYHHEHPFHGDPPLDNPHRRPEAA